jgi:hypothetical protein
VERRIAADEVIDLVLRREVRDEVLAARDPDRIGKSAPDVVLEGRSLGCCGCGVSSLGVLDLHGLVGAESCERLPEIGDSEDHRSILMVFVLATQGFLRLGPGMRWQGETLGKPHLEG